MKNIEGLKIKRIIYIVGAICILLVIILSNENIKLKFTSSTDLSHISCNEMHISDTFENTDNYTYSNEFSAQGDIIKYDNCLVKIDKNNTITFLHANFGDMNISINSNTYFRNIDDIIEVLGINYINNWYDREQRLKQVVYVDHENKLKARFVYDTFQEELVWLILEEF